MKRKGASFEVAFAVSVVAALTLLAWDMSGYAAESPPPAKTQTPQQACQQSLSIGTFAFGGVGRAFCNLPFWAIREIPCRTAQGRSPATAPAKGSPSP